MEQGGPLGDVKYLQKFPSPDSYREKDVHDRRAPTMRSRHPDHDFERSIKVSFIQYRTLGLELISTKIWEVKVTT